MANRSTTAGVIQPAQVLSRGNAFLSRIRTSSPDARSAQAHAEPAGPPPTISTSQVVILRILISPSGLAGIDMGTRPGHQVIGGRSKDDLEELDGTGGKARDRARQVQTPGPHEGG